MTSAFGGQRSIYAANRGIALSINRKNRVLRWTERLSGLFGPRPSDPSVNGEAGKSALGDTLRGLIHFLSPRLRQRPGQCPFQLDLHADAVFGRRQHNIFDQALDRRDRRVSEIRGRGMSTSGGGDIVRV